MRTTHLSVCCVLATALLAAQAPARPDFSGEWVLDPAQSKATGMPARVGGAGPGGVRPPGTITEPRKIKDVPPKYPVEAQRARIGGMVILEATIDRQGKVADLRVLRSVKEFDRAALEAVSQWQYTPTLIDGAPVPIMMTVTVTFTITGATQKMGVTTDPGPPWATQPAGAARPGMGRGFTSAVIEIKQDAEGLALIRKFAETSEEIRYRFDGKASHNKLPGTGGAVDNTYSYLSRWEDKKLVSTIRWTGPQGVRERTEAIWLDGDTLTIQTSRAPIDPGGEPIVQTNVFTRKRQGAPYP